jgi:hypothetical protein
VAESDAGVLEGEGRLSEDLPTRFARSGRDLLLRGKAIVGAADRLIRRRVARAIEARVVDRATCVVNQSPQMVSRPAYAVSQLAYAVSRPADVVSRPGLRGESSGLRGVSSGSRGESSGSRG